MTARKTDAERRVRSRGYPGGWRPAGKPDAIEATAISSRLRYAAIEKAARKLVEDWRATAESMLASSEILKEGGSEVSAAIMRDKHNIYRAAAQELESALTQ